MTAQAKHSQPENNDGSDEKSRVRPLKPGRLPVSEATFDRAGAASPFGDDITFPVPTDRLTYEHPTDS
jgi:hypothetical protein